MGSLNWKYVLIKVLSIVFFFFKHFMLRQIPKLKNRIDSVMVSGPALSAVDHLFELSTQH